MAEQKKITVTIAGVELPSFQQLVLKQPINDHHYFELTLDIEAGELYDTHSLDRTKGWLGKNVEMKFGDTPFLGIVTHVALHRTSGNHGSIVVSGYSTTFLLESDLTCASWLNKTLAEIVEEVCKKAGVPVIAKPEYKASIEYECQYRESNFDFLRRLARQYREWFYYDGRQLIFGKNELPAAIPLTYDREITDMDICVQTLARPLEGQSYNSKSASPSNGASPNAPNGLGPLGQSAFESSMGIFKTSATQYAEMRVASQSELNNYLQRKQQSDSASSHYLSCETDYVGLGLGSVVSVKTAIQVFQSQAIEKNLGSYLITEISHIAYSGNSYRNSFSALSSSVLCLPAPDVPLPVAQTQQAVVVENEDPDGQGRVQVKMNWQTGNMKTSWIRVLAPDAGKSDQVSTNRGFVFIPEKDDLVLVGFRYDDPNRPFVMGSLFNGKTGKGGDSGNKTKSLTTRSGCTITIDDEKGSVTMKDKGGNSYTADGEGNITISASQSIKLCVGETTVTLDSEGNITSNATNSISETAQNSLSQKAAAIDSTADNGYNITATDVAATASNSAIVSGNTTATLDSSGTTAVAGAIIKLN